jgi:hypothetical protein
MNAINYWFQKYLAEKKKVTELEEQVKTAEDHAYFAGSEAMREKLIDKDCEFLKSYRRDYPDGTGYVAGIVDDTTIEELRKFMEK